MASSLAQNRADWRKPSPVGRGWRRWAVAGRGLIFDSFTVVVGVEVATAPCRFGEYYVSGMTHALQSVDCVTYSYE
jgi:hypothetical protein